MSLAPDDTVRLLLADRHLFPLGALMFYLLPNVAWILKFGEAAQSTENFLRRSVNMCLFTSLDEIFMVIRTLRSDPNRADTLFIIRPFCTSPMSFAGHGTAYGIPKEFAPLAIIGPGRGGINNEILFTIHGQSTFDGKELRNIKLGSVEGFYIDNVGLAITNEDALKIALVTAGATVPLAVAASYIYAPFLVGTIVGQWGVPHLVVAKVGAGPTGGYTGYHFARWVTQAPTEKVSELKVTAAARRKLTISDVRAMPSFEGSSSGSASSSQASEELRPDWIFHRPMSSPAVVSSASLPGYSSRSSHFSEDETIPRYASISTPLEPPSEPSTRSCSPDLNHPPSIPISDPIPGPSVDPEVSSHVGWKARMEEKKGKCKAVVEKVVGHMRKKD